MFALLQSQLTVVSKKECDEAYQADFGDKMFCTDNGPLYGTCHGDQGGAAVWKVDGSWEMAGITSWAYACGKFADAFVNLRGNID